MVDAKEALVTVRVFLLFVITLVLSQSLVEALDFNSTKNRRVIVVAGAGGEEGQIRRKERHVFLRRIEITRKSEEISGFGNSRVRKRGLALRRDTFGGKEDVFFFH